LFEFEDPKDGNRFLEKFLELIGLGQRLFVDQKSGGYTWYRKRSDIGANKPPWRFFEDSDSLLFRGQNNNAIFLLAYT